MRLRILTALLLFLALSCNTTDPPDTGETFLQLKALDSSCTETWLQVKLAAAASQRTITLQRDSLTILTRTLTGTDTLIVDEGLLPNRQYTYTLTRPNGSFTEMVTASIRTMDTTSHNWVFSIDTLGDGSSSVLDDVCILSDSLAYAVGAVYKLDSLGNWDPDAYNMVKWDGASWQLMRIQFYTFCGQTGTGSYPAKSIFAFSPTDIWIAMDGSQVVHWNGQNQSPPQCTPVSINKLWGNSSTGELYAVGNGGGIGIRSPTGSWQRLESGTNVDIRDLWGGTLDNRTEIVAVASYGIQVPQAREVLKIEGTTASPVNPQGLPLDIGAVWFMPFRKYLIAGAGLYSTYQLGNSWQKDTTQPLYYVSSIRGTGWNQAALSGSYGHLSHFNGVRWKHFAGSELPYIQGNLSAVAIKGNLLVSVGWLSNGRAIAVIGLR